MRGLWVWLKRKKNRNSGVACERELKVRSGT